MSSGIILDAHGRPITPDPDADGWIDCGISETTGGRYMVRPGWYGPQPQPFTLTLDVLPWASPTLTD